MEAATDADQILQTARQSGEPPRGWTVIPLNRKEVQLSILKWVGASLIGFVLFGLLYAAVSDLLTVIPILVLAMLAFIGLGSLWLVAQKARMLADADRQLIVMTPETYVQQRGSRVIAVPMEEIEKITLRGAVLDESVYRRHDMAVENAVMTPAQMFGGRQSQRVRRSPDSLAFIDARDDSQVIIAEDNSFTELPILENLLVTYVEAARRAHNKARSY